MKKMTRISEIIIVEGRDDTMAVNRAVDALTIETHGYGISDETWEQIDKAYRSRGIIVFTDPDRAGEKIRKRIIERYPDAGEAFLTIPDTLKDGDIGVENASPEDIRAALEKACTRTDAQKEFRAEDLDRNGLTGAGSKSRRERLGKILGIGYGNGGAFLKKLNGYGITREEFNNAIQEIRDQEDI